MENSNFIKGSIHVFIQKALIASFDSVLEAENWIINYYKDWQKISEHWSYNTWHNYVFINSCQASYVYWKIYTGLKDKDSKYIYYGDYLIDDNNIKWSIHNTPEEFKTKKFKDGWYLISYDGVSSPRQKGITKNTYKLDNYKVYKPIEENFR